MEPLKKIKREVSVLIPYRMLNGGLEFFSQKRSLTARTSPNLFGLFGGGLENGEDIHAALNREILEELTYETQNPVYFSRYETSEHILHIFIEEVGKDFESLVEVREGQYGKFLRPSDQEFLNDTSHLVRLIIYELLKSFSRS